MIKQSVGTIFRRHKKPVAYADVVASSNKKLLAQKLRAAAAKANSDQRATAGLLK